MKIVPVVLFRGEAVHGEEQEEVKRRAVKEDKGDSCRSRSTTRTAEEVNKDKGQAKEGSDIRQF